MKIEDFINKPFAKDCKEYEHSFLDLSPNLNMQQERLFLPPLTVRLVSLTQEFQRKKFTLMEQNLRGIYGGKRDPMEMIMGSMLVLSFGILSFMKLLRALKTPTVGK